MVKFDDMKIDLPGLIKEPLPSGNFRYRVRIEGNRKQRITLSISPDHPEFMEIYYAARRGVQLEPEAKPVEKAIRYSVGWLTHAYEGHLEEMVKAGQAAQATLTQRKYFFKSLREHVSTSGKSKGEHFADLDMNIPQEQLISLRDSMAATSGKADNMIAAIRSMYRWAVEDRKLCSVNPAVGIGRIHKGKGGATPWSVSDLTAYREQHPPGTMAHLALTLFMFTACRVSDVILLGRKHEFDLQGTRWIGWDPDKSTSKRVEIPMMPPLLSTLRAQSVIGPTYVLNAFGRPFKTSDSFRNRFKIWCKEAGLPNRSPHGIRKAAGHLLALEGATQYQVMVIHGHAQAKTSEVYTRGVERRRLAQEAMKLLSGMEW